MPVERSFGPNLYTGTAGIALFLGHLYRLTGDSGFRRVCDGAVEHVISCFERGELLNKPGFYAGSAGIAWSLLNLSIILQREELIVVAEKILLPIDFEQSFDLDVMTGSSGTIFGLLYAYRVLKDHKFLAAATLLGDRLVKTAHQHDYGYSWTTVPGSATKDLTGLSHGAAGVSAALLELGVVTQQNRFVRAAEMGFAYEDHWFNSEEGNWPDFRVIGALDPFAVEKFDVAWCHGAPGIGLTRLRAYEITGEERYLHSVQRAISKTREFCNSWLPGHENFSLCHGQAGNAELFINSSICLKISGYYDLAAKIGDHGIEFFGNGDLSWPSGLEGAHETPGLMLGLAGIGYFYLRLSDPESVPSVLLPI